MPPKKKNMNAYLEEVFKQYVAVKDEEKARRVFDAVFNEVLNKMRTKCQYFKKYGKEVMYAGSVYDGIKVSKLDEFDMDIVIRLPICKKGGPNGIILENEQPGYVKMKIENAFDNLVKQKDWEDCHVVTLGWRDEDKYFVQNEFRNWIHGLVHKALNDMGGKVTVGGTTYLVTYRESGPAYTLNVRNQPGSEEFVLDVDLVPVIKFTLPHWPEGYRQLGHSVCRDWLVVPKPNKALEDEVMKNRCWRLSFQEFEREIMKGCHQLKVIIRLVKKLRDVLGMKAIPSYFIKTLFLWEVYENKNKCYWEGKISDLFLDMVEKLKNAIENKEILYFWNDKLNLLGNLSPTLQADYVYKLGRVVYRLKADYVDNVVSLLLTDEELDHFENSDFYKHDVQHNKNQATASTGSSSLPVVNEPASSEPATSEPATSEPASPEPASPNPASSEPGAQATGDPIPTATKSILSDNVSILAQITGLNILFAGYLTHYSPCPSHRELKDLKDKYHELEEKLWKQEDKLDDMETNNGFKEKFEELTSSFNELMDVAEIRGVMSPNEGVPRRLKIGDEEASWFGRHERFDGLPGSSRDVGALLGTTEPSAGSFDDYRPAIGDGGHSIKYKLFKFFFSAVTAVGSTNETGIRAINPN